MAVTPRLLNTDDLGGIAVGTGDSRLSDARPPTAHTHGLADITDEGALASLNTVGTTQIDAGAVTYAKIQDVSAISKLLGRGSAAGAGDVEELTLGTNLSMSGTTLNATGGGGLSDGDYGDITVGGGGTTLTIDTAAVTYAKMQVVSAGSKLLGSPEEGPWGVAEITLGTNLSMTGATLNAAGGSGGGPDWFY